MNQDTKGIVVLISLLLSILAGLSLYPMATGTITIYCSEDAGVNSLYPNTTGGPTETERATAQNPPENRYVYLWMKFDLSSIPSYAQITDIKLYTYCSGSGSYKTPPDNPLFEVTRGVSNTWSETTITWNNQPGLSPGAPEKKTAYANSWIMWQEGFYSSSATDALKTDKKISFVLLADRMSPNAAVWAVWRTREYGGGFVPYILVTYTIPSFKLTVSVKDSYGVAVQGASVTSPFTATTDTSGLASSSLDAGTYTVKVDYQGITYTQTVTLDADKTVSITVTAKFSFRLLVKDQRGNPLPASVRIDTQKVTCDAKGETPEVTVSGTVTVFAEVQVGERTFNLTQTFTVTKTTFTTVTITRRFFWVFFINYTDGTVPARGTITATSPTETLTIPLINGVGKAYLKDETYRIVCAASPEIELRTITITNDGEFYATLDKEKATVETSTTTEIPITSPQTPVTTPAVPVWIRVPFEYYLLLGFAMFVVLITVIAVTVRRRK